MKIRKSFRVLVILAVSLALNSRPEAKGIHRSVNKLAKTTVNFASHALQGYNMRVWLSNQMAIGLAAWDAYSGNEIPVEPHFGLEYPQGSGIEHLYAAGPRLGAIINGVRRVDEGYNGWDGRKEFLPEYRHISREHFWRTSLGSSSYDTLGYSGFYYDNHITVNRKGIDDDGDLKTDEDDLDGLDNDGDWNPITDDVGSDGLPDSLEVSCDGIPYDPASNPDPAGDNYDPLTRDKCHPNPDGSLPLKSSKDTYTEKNGMPDHGEPHVDEDYGAVSDNDLFCTAIDTFRTPVIAGHVPMGAKVIQKSYAWKAGTAADAIIFLDYSFINLKTWNWDDAYIGIFADMDVGPVNVTSYLNHNYSAYDSVLHTAYVHNPIDRGSTPAGVSFLASSRPLDSLKCIYQWSDFSTRQDPGTNDSLIYSWMSGEEFPGQLIAPDQSPQACSDTRFLLTFGPFQVQSLDTLKATYALVSGLTVDEMLNNSRRAKRIYESGYFIMPSLRIEDHGSSYPVKISWDEMLQSPDGQVVSYRLYYGKQSGIYTDSLTTDSLSVTLSGLSHDKQVYFAVRALDDKGNPGAMSDELSRSPDFPRGLRALGQQISIALIWNPSQALDLAGYNVYRHSSLDTSELKLNSVLVASPSFIDKAVRGDRMYHYRVTAVDTDGYESPFSQEVSGRLIPPATPAKFVVGPGRNFFHLNWEANSEGDLAGYNIYRADSSGEIKLTNTLWQGADYIDTSIQKDVSYSYSVEAVDTTGAVSDRSPSAVTHTSYMDQGILVVNNMPCPLCDTANIFFNYLLEGYTYHSIDHFPQVSDRSAPTTLGQYSTVFWLNENSTIYTWPPLIQSYPLALKGYLLGGGKLLMMGRKITLDSYPYWFDFLRDIFGISPLLELSSANTFLGAWGLGGFPSVHIDTVKCAAFGGRLNMVERFTGAGPEKIVFTYLSDPYDSLAEGEPVGLRSADSAAKAYYFSFPLYYIDSAGAKSLIRRVLDDFGEIIGAARPSHMLPLEFKLYDAYPNPFNPSTRIRFDLPAESHVRLTVYDVLGKEIKRLADGIMPAGRHEIQWDASGAASGVYFYRMTIDNSARGALAGTIVTKKILLMK